jgi:hypothetical protein
MDQVIESISDSTRSVEQNGLDGFLGPVEVAQSHPDQSKSLLGAEVHAFPKPQRDARELVAGGGW